MIKKKGIINFSIVLGLYAILLFSSTASAAQECIDCHDTYVSAWNSSKHNNSGAGAPDCTGCHTGYDVQHTGKIVNESNTCRNSGCHYTKDEKHSSSSDCTQCHFANTTKPFSLNTSRSVNDHNLTIIRNFYQYNQSGTIQMPLKSNGGVGVGMFPFYSCDAASCHHHDGTNVKVDNASQTWVESNHAKSLRYPAASDNKNNCAKCKSPLNYNESLKGTNPVIATADWQGINCRVCHNLHNRSFSTGAGPIAFYNATQSSTVGYDVYDKVANATELCEKCHTGATHDSKFGGTHKTVVGFDCADCHLNTANKTLYGERARFNYESHMFEVKNLTTGVTGCEVCHKAADHTFPYTLNHSGKATCEACHDKTVSRNATGYAVSSDGKTYGLYNDTATGEISSWKDSHGAPATWPLHNISKEVSCLKCHDAKSAANNSDRGTLLAPKILPLGGIACTSCHDTYANVWSSSKHNNSGAGAPNCTGCHTGYDVQHTGKIVNESNTCRNSGCHETKDERHRSSGSDCTQCHFANTTKTFSLNESLYVNDHQLTIIRNFYQYNLTGAGNPLLGMPLTSNGGVGLGIFPYYSCTMASCHSHSNLKIENTSQTWLGSNHAKSLRYPAASDNTNSCAKCKSPLNYNVSLPTSTIIAAADWQGINCRVCHNLHNRSFSGSGHVPGVPGPIAFYNGTLSSLAGYDVYEQVSNATVLCEKCHNGNSHDSRYAGTHKNTLNFTCISCHMNTTTGSFNFQNHMFEVKNETSGVTGCEVCHKAADHTFVYTANHNGKATCEACHDKTVSRNATGYATSSDGKTYGLYNDTATGEISSWKDSHGVPATWPLHNISRAVSCDKCHGTKSKPTGALLAPAILPHTGTGACAQCHLGYPGSFVLPANNNCLTCHTTNADTYGAPNIIGTSMAYYPACGGGSCHGNDITDRLDTMARHNVSRTFAGIGGYTDTVLLNNQGVLTVTKGTIVTITSRVNDTMRYGGASRVGGAEYYIGTDPGQGKGTPMLAADGYYNALGANWESVTATINTSTLSNSTNTIYVRGRDIGNQWSAPQSATLLLISSGYINGTVNVTGGGPLSGATVSTGYNSTTTALDGSYSLLELTGTYTVTVSKRPTHSDNITSNVVVIDGSTRILNAALDERPTGNVTGSVTTG